jgi:hypothetical protein
MLVWVDFGLDWIGWGWFGIYRLTSWDACGRGLGTFWFAGLGLDLDLGLVWL